MVDCPPIRGLHTDQLNTDQLKRLIREVPDFPKKGILFYDITTLLKDKVGFATLVDRLSEHYLSQNIDLVLGMEARGFNLRPALAYRLNAGFVPVRKVGKTSRCNREVRLCIGIRHQLPGDAQGCNRERDSACSLWTIC